MRARFLFLAVIVCVLTMAGCDSMGDHSFYQEPPAPSKNRFDEESFSNTYNFSDGGKVSHTYESSYDTPRTKVYKNGEEVLQVPPGE